MGDAPEDTELENKVKDDMEEEGYSDMNDESSCSSKEEESANELVTNILKQASSQVVEMKSKFEPNLLQDLSCLQLGQMGAHTYTRRRCDSVGLLRRLGHLSQFEHNHRTRLRVNSLNFNYTGSKLASASYDEKIVVWDWEKSLELFQFDSGHSSDMYQAKFLPGDLRVISCARDGQVRLVEVSVTGEVMVNKNIGNHEDSDSDDSAAHRLSLVPDCPYLVLSAGSDGQVLSVDIREMKSESLLQLKNGYGYALPLYSVHSNPVNGNCFCTSGQDPFIRIYDRRFLTREKQNGELVKFTADDKDGFYEIFQAFSTSAAFSDDGQAVIGSFNNETICLFNASDPEGSPPIHHYQGHRSDKFLMGVHFYGQNSKYIISGSDCGNIFIWDRETEGVVQVIPGYEPLMRTDFEDQLSHGLVIEPHPTLPVLASSAHDNVVKMWMPVAEENEDEQKEFMFRTIHGNMTDRHTDTSCQLM